MPFVKRHRDYYKYGNEANATVVGSFGKVLDGVASGFSASNYLNLPENFDVSDGSNWEMVWKITTPSSFTAIECFLGRNASSAYTSKLMINATGLLTLVLSNNSKSWLVSFGDSESLLVNTTYLVKVEYSEGVYSLYKSINIEEPEWVLVGSQEAGIYTMTDFTRIGSVHDTGSSAHFPFQGSIDLSQSYININGERWWSGDEYVTVGSWIDEGVVSGFSTSKYLTLPEMFPTGVTNFEIMNKVKFSSFSTTQYFFNTAPYYSFLLGVDTSGKLSLHLSSNVSTWDVAVALTGSAILDLDTWYYIKSTYDGATYNIYLSKDNETWDLNISLASTSTAGVGTSLGRIGHGWSDQPATHTSFDLSQSYIKINNKLWWNGVKAVETTVDDYVYYIDRNKLYQLAKSKRFFYKYSNETDVKIVGNRSIIKNGVASDFKAASYLLLPDTFDVAGGKTWEIVTCFTTGSDITTEGNLVGTNYYRYDPIAISITSSHFVLEVCSGTGTQAFELTGSYTVQANTKYWLRVSFNGSEYVIEYSLDGIDWIVDTTKASTASAYSQPLIIGGQAASENGTVKFPWLGSIDLNETYMSIDGERWWDISKGYTVVGKWIDENIASGFSTSQYLSIPLSFNQAVQGRTWEIVGKFNLNTLGVRNAIFGGASGTYLVDVNIYTDNKFILSLSSNGSSWNIANTVKGTYVFETGVDYWAKLTFDGSKYVLSYSLDGVDYTEDVVVESAVQIESTADLLNIGFRSEHYLRGSIDLNECYVKINNKLWWHGTKVIDGDKNNYAFYEDRLLSYVPILKSGKQFISLFESATGGTYDVTIPEDCNVRVTMVGGGGAAAMRGVYDDKGYGWGGGSGGAFIGTFALTAGTYSVTVGSANNNTTKQSSNSQTSNPSDTTTHDSYIDGVVRIGGGGCGHYNSSYVGAAGASATFEIEPLSVTMNKEGNVGKYNSGGKGSAAAATCAGGVSVWGGYGTGQGCKTSEYAGNRGWINGTGGYVRIEMWTQTGEQLY